MDILPFLFLTCFSFFKPSLYVARMDSIYPVRGAPMSAPRLHVMVQMLKLITKFKAGPFEDRGRFLDTG